MKKSAIAVTVALALSPLAASAQNASATARREVVLHGCVMPGADRNSYVMTKVMEMPGPDGSVMPEVAHGRRVLFWLDNDGDVKRHMGRMVEVRGEFTGLQESEIELKAGRQKDGRLLVEFEGPGKDVVVPNETVGAAIGTAGRTEAEKNDIPTYLARVNVRMVRVMSGECK
jgi:hypothetical protein